ncbi:hypothetical protein ACF3NT_11505 [Naumannella halotolerans]|uniref:hypothetical protein n=1 Tax=Naumannella halotolerans TaxID=993414 RepID=UPI00370D3D94
MAVAADIAADQACDAPKCTATSARSRDGHTDAVRLTLTSLGELVEYWSIHVISVDCVSSRAQDVADFLFSEERAGRLIYETGKS